MNSNAKKEQPISALPAENGLMVRQKGDSIFDRTYRQLRSLPRQMRRFLQRRFGMSLAKVALALAKSGTPIASVVQAQHLLDPALAADERVPDASITVDGTDCTLIEAIDSANDDDAAGNGCVDGSGADTITLQADVTLSAVNNSANGPNGLPSITSEITIEGAGHTIERQSSAPDFRIFHVAGSPTSGDLTLNETTVSGGSQPLPTNNGSGIFNSLIMMINNSTISGNAPTNNGGGISNNGIVVISRSTISNNNSSYYSSGIYNAASMMINDSTISGNESSTNGGGLSKNELAVILKNIIIAINKVIKIIKFTIKTLQE